MCTEYHTVLFGETFVNCEDRADATVWWAGQSLSLCLKLSFIPVPVGCMAGCTPGPVDRAGQSSRHLDALRWKSLLQLANSQQVCLYVRCAVQCVPGRVTADDDTSQISSGFMRQ